MLKMNTFKFIATAFAVASVGAVLDATTNPAHATCGTDPYMGSICATAATFCPKGYAQTNGQIMSISDNTALFALLGAQYGGDGRTTFGLPDLRGRSIVSAGTGPGLAPTRQSDRRGRDQMRLPLSALPTHAHAGTISVPTITVGVQVSPATATKSVPAAGDYIAAPASADRDPILTKGYVNATDKATTVALGGVSSTTSGDPSVTINNTGNGQPLITLPPQLTLLYCIALQGVFPPRPN